MPDGANPRGRDAATIVTAAKTKVDARNRGVLTVLSGADAGRVVAVPIAGLSLGRSHSCELSFDDASLSRVHARALCILGEQFVLRDEGSTNGTFVNDARVTDSVLINDGDRIRLGTATLLRFSVVDEVEEKAMCRVFEAGRTDALTGVGNRRSFEERLESEVSYALRHSAPLSLVMLDIDLFKKVNDTHGHPAGDAVLRAVGSMLLRGCRAEDAVARYGGEEFAILMRGTDLSGACVIADRLRAEIGARPVDLEGTSISITASAGVASLECCGKFADGASLVARADKRLYAAKEQGRNRVIGREDV
jgi:two-component system cell cycle response regulator